jgi:hypothetical protein
MTEEMLTEDQKTRLGWMAHCYEASVGRLPETMEALADHWCGMGDIRKWETIFTDVTLDDDERRECAMAMRRIIIHDTVWLGYLEERPDADALLDEAIEINARLGR